MMRISALGLFLASLVAANLANAQGVSETRLEPTDELNQNIELHALPILLKGGGLTY
jgi:hypothetical protein